MDKPVLLTVEEFAEAVNFGRTLVYARVKSGEIKSVKIGKLRRIPATELDAFVGRLLAEQSTGSAA